ncbi:MAG: carboxypeptidase-like regulatory domain-containing protein, partial [Bacteroidota bacterium]
IKGSVTPLESNPAIYALNGTDTVASTFPDVDGKFLIRALPAATYHVKFAPKTGYLPKEIIDVDVTTGTIKDLGAVTIEQ